MKMYRSLLGLVLLSAALGACTSTKGCTGDACKRPESNNRDMVIWWPSDMRQGLGDADNVVDFTLTPLEN